MKGQQNLICILTMMTISSESFAEEKYYAVKVQNRFLYNTAYTFSILKRQYSVAYNNKKM